MSFWNIIYTILIGPLQLFFETIYSISYRVIGNPGLCIIVLSLAMNFLVLPLYRRADAVQAEERDMEAKLKHGVDHIKKTFRGDDRMMILQTYYRQNNYHPLNALKGSVSLFLEIPFFIAAYRFLSNLSLLEGVSFGPIHNLGAVDSLISIGSVSINILPFIMTGINLISCAIYTKGYPAKTKVQLYGMAIFFLAFLYSSPAGLVFYWTLNNLFSLIKTIFYKLKNPRLVLAILSATVSVGLFVISILKLGGKSSKVYFVVICLAIAMLIPLISYVLNKKGKLISIGTTVSGNHGLFTIASFVLTILVGFLIPSAVIADSPVEFINAGYYYNPLWYICNSLCLSIGLFLVWFRVFFMLADNKGKNIFEISMVVLAFTGIINYMFFGNDLGIMNSSLIYDTGMIYSVSKILVNIFVIVLIAAICIFIFVFRKNKILYTLLVIISISFIGMSTVNATTINQSIESYKNALTYSDTPKITLSKTGKNVVVIMLDRAIGLYVPYMMNEKPELQEQFSGFTYYNNVVSYGAYTNIGTPSLLGGYEYTPEELNKRDEELMVNKHNEALLTMPVLFGENGYEATVFNPPYANYQWIPDLSVYSDYDYIHAYNTYYCFSSPEQNEFNISNLRRNFFCYSIMRITPLAIQPTMYDVGAYNSLSFYSEEAYLGQSVSNKYTSSGLNADAMDYYNTLVNLSHITTCTESNVNQYFFFDSELSHDVQLYQEPDYTPSMNVDNREYESTISARLSSDGSMLKIETVEQMTHYHANMISFMQLGKWFDHLKENGVYDNTRIILVSDHGSGVGQFMQIGEDNGNSLLDLEYYYPLLMVKDFNSDEFTTSNEFMTNADVPTLSVTGLLDTPINPFTGNKISNALKYEDNIHILASDAWGINFNNSTILYPGDWISVHDNIFDSNNWEIEQINSTSPRAKKDWNK